jgi:beta-alanine degradation protein BauB
MFRSIRPVLAGAVVLIWAFPLGSQQPATLRVPQFENADVAVWKTTVMPNAPLQMHTHEHPRIIVALRGGTLRIIYENGQSETQKWETGKAYWLSSEEGKRRHADSNQGDKPIEVMVVELKNAK